jgi:uncharacterized protein
MDFLPRGDYFYDLFDGMAHHAVVAAEQLRQLARTYPPGAEQLQRIRDEEHAADELAHAALAKLDRSLIVPLHRGDIHMLVQGLDDIIDDIDAVAKRFPLYHLNTVEAAFQKQSDVLVQAAVALQEAIHRLRHSRKVSELSDRLIEIHRLENLGDENNHAAVSSLYEGRVEPLTVMKWKELYDLIENAIDGCEDVGNTLERIVLRKW